MNARRASSADGGAADLVEDATDTILDPCTGDPAPLSESETRPASTGRGLDVSATIEPEAMVDHFRVVRELGRGGMGAVYLATDTKLGRRVALKIIPPDELGSPEAIARFLNEARATASFNHPHIVTVYAVGEHAGRPYVALEYLEGDDLGKLLKERKPRLAEALDIALAIAEALEEAHAHGILHRDLKPANIVIPTDGRLRVVDFGLAKRLSHDDAPPSSRHGTPAMRDLTYAGAGTPRYMAPEQWAAEPSSRATDVWALGVLLFMLRAGHGPYADVDTIEDMQLAVLSPEPAPRLDDIPEVPPALAVLVARCLDKQAERRPTASEVAAALRELREQVSSSREQQGSEPPPLDERATPLPDDGDAVASQTADRMVATASARKSSRWSGRLVVALVALVGIAAGYGLQARRPSPIYLSGLRLSRLADVAPPITSPPTATATATATTAGRGEVLDPLGPAEPSPSGAPPERTALSDAAAPSAAVPPASSGQPTQAPRRRPFDMSAAVACLQRRAKVASSLCRSRPGPRSMNMTVEFMPGGHVRMVRFGGRPGVSQAERCATGVMRACVLKPFDGAPMKLQTGVSLPPIR